MYFYRDHEGVELDFVIESGARLHLVEAKWTETPTATDARAFGAVGARLHADARAPSRVWRRTLVSRTVAPFPVQKGVDAVHVFDLEERLT